jgi:hypothetical protein
VCGGTNSFATSGEVTQEVTLKHGREECGLTGWERGQERGVGEDGLMPLRKAMNHEAGKEIIEVSSLSPPTHGTLASVLS